MDLSILLNSHYVAVTVLRTFACFTFKLPQTLRYGQLLFPCVAVVERLRKSPIAHIFVFKGSATYQICGQK